MPVHRDYVKQIFDEMGNDLLEGHRLRSDFLKKLEDDDDWSFVIKIQALVEAALTEAIVSVLGEPRVKRMIERLALADEENGKLRIATELGLLDKRQRRFIRRMANLRNQLAHRISDVDFKFSQFITSLDASQAKDWQESLAWFALDRDSSKFWLGGTLSAPRTVVWVGTLMLLSTLHVAVVEVETKRKIDAAVVRTAEEIFNKAAVDGDD